MIGASSSSKPRSWRSIAIVVVAIGFVSEARSKSVAGMTVAFWKSEFPGFCNPSDNDGALSSSSSTNLPKALRARSSPARVTATEAAGKTRSRMASRSVSKADEKTAS